MDNKWRTQDWYWTIAILIGIIVLILTFRLSDNQEITNLFSFISSSVSIALALIAIFISLKQNSDNQTLTNEMSAILVRIDEKIKYLDDKVSNLDPSDITKKTEVDLTSIVKKVIKENDNDKETMIEQLQESIKEKFDYLNDDLKNYLQYKNDDNIVLYKQALMMIYIKRILENLNGQRINHKELIARLTNQFNISRATALRLVNELLRSGEIKKDDNGFYIEAN